MSRETKPFKGAMSKNNECVHEFPVPKLPLPQLAQTLAEYLSAIEAVVSADEFRRAKSQVREFSAPGGVGESLQTELQRLYESKENWVYDWWLDDMYMKNRLPLPVNSNPGMVFPKQHFRSQDDQVRFAVKLVIGVVEYKLSLDSNTFPVDMSGGKNPFPFCMAQHYRLLTSYRRPEAPKDILVSTSRFHDGYHIIVACNGQFFELKVTQNKEIITKDLLTKELQRILKTVKEESPEAQVGVLTSEQRDKWTNARKLLVKETMNENSLSSIEKSLCLVCFEEPLPVSMNYGGKESDLRDESNVAHHMLYGGGSMYSSGNRWFDKTMQLVISSDGFCGLCYEHSAAEGVVVIQLLEKLIQLPNDNENNTMKQTTARWPPAKKLRWNVDNPDLQLAITDAKQHIDKLGKDLDFYVLRFNDYGREYAKKNKISPDVFIQLALQLAYYKVHRHLASTYESAATRKFQLGRVDNIRAATLQALNWAKSMEGSGSNEDKCRLFRTAIARQTEIMTSNITGQGIDCHLLALRELAAEREIQTPALFWDECYAQFNNFKLSTSQVSTQTDSFMGYGAVVPDGYGASYNLKADSILFCITSFHSCPDTNSAFFADNLVNSLLHIKDILTSS